MRSVRRLLLGQTMVIILSVLAVDHIVVRARNWRAVWTHWLYNRRLFSHLCLLELKKHGTVYRDIRIYTVTRCVRVNLSNVSFVSDIRVREYIHLFLINRRKRAHTSCVNYRKPFCWRLVATVQLRCSLSHPPVRITMVRIERFTCAPFSLVYTLSAFTIASVQIGSVGRIQAMYRG